MLQKYTVSNFKFSSEFKLYDCSVPTYLQDCSHCFVKHCMQRMHAAKSDFKSDVVQQGKTYNRDGDGLAVLWIFSIKTSV